LWAVAAAYAYQYVTEWEDTRRKDIPIGLAPHPERSEIVRRLYRDIAFYSAIDLARQLTAEGVPTRTGRSSTWRHSTIRQILRNPVHKGEWYFEGIMVPVPPIVDERTWETAQQMLVERQQTRRGRYPEHADPY
jgi:hypothetical protein